MKMNREIKFRVYVKEDEYSHEDMHYVDLSDSVSEYDSRVMAEFPLMQYTGLKDKNGVEIYEGDIVDAVAEEEHKEHSVTSDIIFCNGTAWTVRSVNKDFVCRHGLSLDWGGWVSIEVIGNIYENPELLTQSIND